MSLHDVTPRHAAPVRQILSWLAERAIAPAQLLVVPDFHGKWPLEGYPDFCQELSAWRGKGHELVLHGHYHQEAPRPADLREPVSSRLKRSFMTAGEGEFLSLPAREAGALLDRALRVWELSGLGEVPGGFIPPAWLHRPDLDQELWKRGFSWTEDHAGFRFRDGLHVPSPVVTWASRDPVRRIGSRIYCPLAVRLRRSARVLRLAIHPHDFDHPQLIRSIDRTLELALSDGRSVSNSDPFANLRRSRNPNS